MSARAAIHTDMGIFELLNGKIEDVLGLGNVLHTFTDSLGKSGGGKGSTHLLSRWATRWSGGGGVQVLRS
jgi:hypothetical protein